MEKCGRRRYSLEIPERGNHLGLSANSPRVRSGSFLQRRQSIRRLRSRQAYPDNAELAIADWLAHAHRRLRRETVQVNRALHLHKSFRWEIRHQRPNHRASTAKTVRGFLVPG